MKTAASRVMEKLQKETTDWPFELLRNEKAACSAKERNYEQDKKSI